ncbi:MAG: prepilin-type N-terminal cleavage/methylation domain-containing protein [Candidatus Omnitrophica bacterium]|nr:prepilin-type N-terminal cleavage/methylation domain-containing protein [Candidatus Omnitrophota bacterium]
MPTSPKSSNPPKVVPTLSLSLSLSEESSSPVNPNKKQKSFTLVELIIVIIIVGILAAVGISQYSLTVEKGRTAEAKTRIGTMRQLAYQYYLENGSLSGITNADVGMTNTCTSTDFYNYYVSVYLPLGVVKLVASRCTSNGKTPNASSSYYYYQVFTPSSGNITWYSCKASDNSSYLGLPCCAPGYWCSYL